MNREKLKKQGYLSYAPYVIKLCREQAIDCGYAALACAVEGKTWERFRYQNLMKRFTNLSKRFEDVQTS